MLLAIDAGNTNLVFALVKAGEIKTRWRIATDPRRTADEMRCGCISCSSSRVMPRPTSTP